MLVNMESRGNTHPLLVGLQSWTASVEMSVAVLQENGNRFTSRSSYITLGHIPKWHFVLSWRHCSTMFIAVLFIISRNWKQARCHSTDEEVWYIYTIEYYSAVKKNETMEFSGKWIHLGKKFMLSGLSQNQKEKYVIWLYIDISFLVSDNQPIIPRTTEVRSKIKVWGTYRAH